MGESESMLVGMSKEVYKEMVKEMNIITSREEPSQKQCALEVCNHLIYSFMYIKFNYHMKY